MEIPQDAQRRLATDHVVWLSTVTDAGAPAPWPVWFVTDGDDIVVFSEPTSRRVHNIGQRPRVTLHFNSDVHGGDVCILGGTATVTPGSRPSAVPGYVDKYGESIGRDLQSTVEAIDATYDAEIRIRPTRATTF